MARPVTCDIKTKPKKTYHLSEENVRLMDRCRIEVEHNLGRHIEVTTFVNTLIAIATEHINEITDKFRSKNQEGKES